MTDELWAVIADTMKKFNGLDDRMSNREALEALEVQYFDGGAFIAKGNEFDIFVTPEKRGKWPIKRLINAYVNNLIDKFGSAIVTIDERNKVSLRLALGFGFSPIEQHGTSVRLEKRL